jgi:putative ABC transport system permease protein
MRALRRNKLRSALTALGIIIGVGAVIAMVSIGNGAKAQVEGQIASLGRNVLSVFPGSYSTGGARGGWGSASTLTPEDAESIAREVPGVVAVSCEVRDRQQVQGAGLNWNAQIMGESPTYLDIRACELAEGVMFTDIEVQTASKVAVLGKTVVEQLFGNASPVGETIRIRNLPFIVIGVLKPKGVNYFGMDQDDVVIVPYTSAMRRISRRQYLSAILIQAAAPEQMSFIQTEAGAVLQQRRVGREPDFSIRSQLELAQAATATTRTMTWLLGGIAGVSLVVGGIGIMNIMLVSVTERTREIGIRLAVGARGRDILLQFLIEAVTLSLLGGIIGTAVGIATSQIFAKALEWPSLISVSSIVIALAFSMAVGVFFGFYPARKAARLDPIEALRYE